MCNEKYIDKMFEKYIQWFKDDSFTKEVAAFEYMKRNPYFISIASLYMHNYEISPSDYSHCYYDDRYDSHYNKYYTQFSENITNENLLYLKKMLQQVFFYSGFDIDNVRHQELDPSGFSIVKRYQKILISEFRSNLNKYLKTAGYYSNIYSKNIKQNEKIEDHVSALKKEFALDSNIMYSEGESLRWLQHLLSSVYIKINPWLRTDDQKSMLTNMNAQINDSTSSQLFNKIFPNPQSKNAKKLTEFESHIYLNCLPDVLLQEYGTSGRFNFKAPTFQSIKSLVSLIIYDILNIYRIEEVTEIRQILEDKLYSEVNNKTKIENEFDKYFQFGGPNYDYGQYIFNVNHRDNNIKNVLDRINGKYLEYIYPEKSIREHYLLLYEAYKAPNFEEKMQKDKVLIRNLKKIFDKKSLGDLSKLGFVPIDIYEKEEYKSWSEDLFSLLSKEKHADVIFPILLL